MITIKGYAWYVDIDQPRRTDLAGLVTELSDTVCFSFTSPHTGEELYFDSELHHLGCWADEHDIRVVIKPVVVTVEEPSDE